jgi:hypothetical protein
MDLTIAMAALGIIATVFLYIKGFLSGKNKTIDSANDSKQKTMLHKVEKVKSEIQNQQAIIKEKSDESEQAKKAIKDLIQSENTKIQEVMKKPEIKKLMKEFYEW